jgi:hypothetical protein
MQIIDIPTEQTTAATDLLLGILAIGVVVYLLRLRDQSNRSRVTNWMAVFGLLAIAATIGALAHGLVLSDETRNLLWQPINLALGLAIGMFVVAVVHDLWGQALARRTLPVMLVVGLVFYGITVAVPGSFLVFILYEAVAMLFALAGYVWLALRKKIAGTWYLVVGILLMIAAAAIQASGSVRVTAIWEFDHNGIFHILQMVATLVLVFGLRIFLSDVPPE